MSDVAAASGDSEDLPEEKRGFYEDLRERVTAWAEEKGDKYEYSEYILLAPDLLHLLCKLVADDDVPTTKKAQLAVVVTYFISPYDVIPEGVVGSAGYIDDVYLAAYVVDSLLNEVDKEVVQRHWAGDKNVLFVVRSILETATEALGSDVLNKLKKAVNGAEEDDGDENDGEYSENEE